MCGIFGYIGKKKVNDLLIEGLKKLEYRGYDSAGVALLSDGEIIIEKTKGKVRKLEERLQTKEFSSPILAGIAHTRWATHGEPTTINAHPHSDTNLNLAIVHNGIIENYFSLKKYLVNKGHQFISDTDTEIFAHLIEDSYDGDLLEAVQKAVLNITGSFAFAIIEKGENPRIIGVKKGSPLLLGIGENEFFLSSDISAIIKHTSNCIYMEEEEIVEITDSKYQFFTFHQAKIEKEVQSVQYELNQIEKDGFAHFMLKEIYEQPDTIINATRGRINLEEATSRLDGLDQNLEVLKKLKRIVISACGTSWHAGMIGEYYIEKLANIPTEVEYASEFRYRDPILTPEDLCFFISQSGETADTIAALEEAKRKFSTCLGICNVVNSSIARLTDGGVYLHAGPEIGVASTKAFTSQVTVLIMIAVLLGRMRHLAYEDAYEILNDLKNIPNDIKTLLKQQENIKNIAHKIKESDHALFLGRGVNFPVALEGALKLKEISYIHAEGYPAAEMKHGPIALIDENMPVIIIATQDPIYEKLITNVKEVKARKGIIVSVVTEGDTIIKEISDYTIEVPKTHNLLSPLINVVPLQLLSYYCAVFRGCDVDQPRNLAKSVTVE